MSTAYSGDGITFPDNSVQATAPRVGMVNRIINGDMRIDQRNAGASITPTNGAYTLDRWFSYQNVASKYSVQQTTTTPAGFINSLKATSLSAYSVAATDVFTLNQSIEGLNIADFGWGTASAATVTLSFRVYSSLTGTFGGSLINSGFNRSYPFTYTISSANTWTTISVTVAGDTSGTWLTTNGVGVTVLFGLGVGSTYSGAAGAWAGNVYYGAAGATSVVGTSGATFYITGVQLEKGSTATDFEYVDYGRQLQMCQRYYEVLSPAYVMFPWGSGSQIVRTSQGFRVTKRAAPTVLMGAKATGAGTMGAAGVTVGGVTYFGSGSFQDVVGYDTPTAEIEL